MSDSSSSSQNTGGKLAAGSTFGRYRIQKQLGEGAMGAVFLAHDTKLNDRPVALKVPKFAGDDREMELQRFHREAGIAATLSHPNLCPVYDVGELDGIHYLAMGFIEGKPLNEVLGGKPVAEKQAALLVRKIALAMAAAHEKGVVHRDLKPANIMLDARKEPIVMDFGLAKQKGGINDAHITQSGMILGTPAYMSPEQVNGELNRMGPPADVYSLGVILYELLTGVRPFQGPITSVLGQILSKEPPPPRQHRPNLDPRLEAIILKAMAKKIEDRYRSMPEFAAALADFVKQLNTGSSVIASKEDETVKAAEEISLGSVAALVDAARQCLKAHDYAEALRLFETVPLKHRSEEIEALRSLSEKRQDEVDGLQMEIDLACEARKYKTLVPKLERMLKLKPGHAEAKKLLNRLTSYGGKHAKLRFNDAGELLAAPKADGLFAGMGLRYAAVVAVALVAFGIGSALIYPNLREKPSIVELPSIPPSDGSASPIRVQQQPVRGPKFALDFDGKASYVETPLRIGPEPKLTLEAWCVPRGETRQIIVCNFEGAGCGLFLDRRIAYFGGTPATGNYVELRSPQMLELSRRVHLAGVLDEKELRFYVNGKFAERRDFQGPFKAFPVSFVIGANPGPSLIEFFDGLIDEVRISKDARYDRDFTSQQRFESDKDSLALYHFDEGQGDVLNDSSGNNHHGKIFGAKWVRIENSASE